MIVSLKVETIAITMGHELRGVIVPTLTSVAVIVVKPLPLLEVTLVQRL